MAKSVPKILRGRSPVNQRVGASKTPAGVWVIVGLAVFFVMGGLGISAFVVWKAIGVRKAVPAAGEAVTGMSKPVLNAPIESNGEVGVEQPGAKETVQEAGLAPSVIKDRTEEDRMRQEVLNRIDLMRALTDTDKDKLYAQVERARGFTKIAIIPFAENRALVGPAQMDGLIKSLKGPALQKLLSDPTVALIIVGYADRKGEETKNLDISRSRAESVVEALKVKMDLVNVLHAVAMGGQDLFDHSDAEKNRVVEVWAVQP